MRSPTDTVLLCRLFHDRVMCVHQIMTRGPQEPVSYERGRLLPQERAVESEELLGTGRRNRIAVPRRHRQFPSILG